MVKRCTVSGETTVGHTQAKTPFSFPLAFITFCPSELFCLSGDHRKGSIRVLSNCLPYLMRRSEIRAMTHWPNQKRKSMLNTYFNSYTGKDSHMPNITFNHIFSFLILKSGKFMNMFMSICIHNIMVCICEDFNVLNVLVPTLFVLFCFVSCTVAHRSYHKCDHSSLTEWLVADVFDVQVIDDGSRSSWNFYLTLLQHYELHGILLSTSVVRMSSR